VASSASDIATPTRPMTTTRFFPQRLNQGMKRSPTRAPTPVGAKMKAALSADTLRMSSM